MRSLLLVVCFIFALPVFAEDSRISRKPAMTKVTALEPLSSPSLHASLQGEIRLPAPKSSVAQPKKRGPQDSKVGPFRVKAAGQDTPRSFAENAYFE